jgi:predicted secreted protein
MVARADMAAPHELARRRRVRRTALVCAAVALFFYLGFIVLMLVRGSR